MVNTIVIHAELKRNPYTHTRVRSCVLCIVTHSGTKMNKRKPPQFTATRKVTLLFGIVNNEIATTATIKKKKF